ncbi:MAG: imidazole glycerol phosphate synthase subunit HisH [Chitinophagaceae bacterium]
MITIINYGVGNLTSIKNMLNRANVDSVITAEPEVISEADKLILPGVGSFDYGMEQLHKSGLVDTLNQKVVIDKTPILGICLGVQLFTEVSDEGKLPGLGWIKGQTVSFTRSPLTGNLKIPHMGWTDVFQYQQSKLFADMYEDPRFYFVHSYHLSIDNPVEVLVRARYGDEFAAGVERENIVGVQFHPEKSHKYGYKILENFAKYY